MFNKRFMNFQSQLGHDIKIILDDDRKHIMIETRSYLERNLYFPEFVNLIMMIKNNIAELDKTDTQMEFQYLSPTDTKPSHAIRCINGNKAFILMTINSDLKVDPKFITTYSIFLDFADWLQKEYLIDEFDTNISTNLKLHLNSLACIYRI